MNVWKIFIAWIGTVGGVLWALKILYDAMVLERQLHEAAPPSDLTDYTEFLIPLMCISSTVLIFQRYRSQAGIAPYLLALGLLLTSGFHAAEAFLTDSNIPFGLLFFLFGSILVLIGSILLLLRLRQSDEASSWLKRSVFALCVSMFIFCLTPFVAGWLTYEIEKVVTLTAMVLTGLSWGSIGGALAIEETNVRDRGFVIGS